MFEEAAPRANGAAYAEPRAKPWVSAVPLVEPCKGVSMTRCRARLLQRADQPHEVELS